MSQNGIRTATPLPPGWEWVLLADVAQINPPLDLHIDNDDVGVNFVPMKALDVEGGGIVRPERRPYGEVKRGYTPFVSGDVIMAKITPCMENGKTAVATDLDGNVFFGSTEFHVIRPECGVQARWLANYLLQHEVRRAAQRQMGGGVGQMRVPAAFLDSLTLPLPSTAEQQRILDEVAELHSGLDAGVAAMMRAQAKLKRYRAAVLMAAVEGTLVPGQSVPAQYPIGMVVETVYQGWSPKCERDASTDPEIWAVIKTTAIQPMRFLPAENKRLPSALTPRPHLQLAQGDLVMTRAGPRTRAGVTCLVRQSRSRLMLCDKAYLIRCKDNIVLPMYLEVCLNAPHIVDALDALKTGISDSGVNLTQTRLKELVIPIPSLAEQHVIVEAVEDQLSVIDHLEADLEAKVKSAQGLRQSILRHAFTGQLVPQDANDKPVAELLKCIAAEREERARDAAIAKRANKQSTLLPTTRKPRATKNARKREQ